MFEVVYILKKGPEMSYRLLASDAVDARQKANYWFSIESGGATVKKVTVKAIPPETE